MSVVVRSANQRFVRGAKNDYLDRLLGRLSAIESVDILPGGRALGKYAGMA